MMSEPVSLDTPYSLGQKAMLEDISVGGACVRTHARLKPGDAVSLLVSLGLGKRVDARGRIVYALTNNSGYQTRYGLRFVGLGGDAADQISEFVVEQKFGRQFGVRPFRSSFEREEE
jgi:c-di-GMP-binding flagellar brake protein YcgR